MSLIREIAEMAKEGFDVHFYEYRPSIYLTDNTLTVRVRHRETDKEYAYRLPNHCRINEDDAYVVTVLRAMKEEHDRRSKPPYPTKP